MSTTKSWLYKNSSHNKNTTLILRYGKNRFDGRRARARVNSTLNFLALSTRGHKSRASKNVGATAATVAVQGTHFVRAKISECLTFFPSHSVHIINNNNNSVHENVWWRLRVFLTWHAHTRERIKRMLTK